MAQGKAYNKEEVIRSLEPYFKLGCNIKKACDYAGVPYTTVHTWVSNDEELRIKITAWQNELNLAARRVYATKIAADDFQAADKWLSKREKDEFSDRTEHTGADGKDLPTPILTITPNVIHADDSDTESSEPQ